MEVKISAKELEECLFDITQMEKLHQDKFYEKKLKLASIVYNSLEESNLIDEATYPKQALYWSELADVSYKEITSYNRLKNKCYILSLSTLDIASGTIQKEELLLPNKITRAYIPNKKRHI